MTGKQASTFSVQGASADASNTLTYDVAATSLLDLGVFKSMTFRLTNNLINIKPANYVISNYVPNDIDWDVELTDIRLATGATYLGDYLANGSILRVLCQNTNIATPGNVFCCIGRIQSGGWNQGEGEHNANITLKPVGVNPYWGPIGSLPI